MELRFSWGNQSILDDDSDKPTGGYDWLIQKAQKAKGWMEITRATRLIMLPLNVDCGRGGRAVGGGMHIWTSGIDDK